MPNWEQIRREWEASEITFKELAEKYGIKDSTIRSRKNREKWQRNNATQRENVATNKSNSVAGDKKKASSNGQKKRSGNPNPKNQFTKRNRAAVTHGFFSKYIPEETMEIMEQMQESSPADLIYDQIQIQYAAIIRAQQIMHVASKDEMIKELKKEKTELHNSRDKDGNTESTPTYLEREYEFQFAWDRHATFLNAQSRAMSELRSLIKQFIDMAHEDDERRLKLEQMQLGIEKTRAEIDKISIDNTDKPIEIIIKRKGEGS